MNKNLETIRSVCIKANPSIMELGFGCRFDNGSGFEETFLCELGDGSRMMLDSDGQPFRHHGELIKRFIRGRPICLADVLSAIGFTRISHMGEVDSIPGIDFAGRFYIISNHSSRAYPQKVGSWNLLKDDLREQSEDTLAFLASLLTNEK